MNAKERITNRTLVALLGLAVCLLGPTPLLAQLEVAPKFKKAVIFPVGAEPFGVAAGDINGNGGDGFPDIAVANAFADTVTVYLNTGDWTPVSDGFGTPNTLSLTAGAGPAEVVFARINADVHLDLVVSAQIESAVYVFLNDANNPGQFLAPDVYLIPDFFAPVGLVVADFDNDGFNDAAVASGSDDKVVVLFNNGNGELNAAQVLIDLGLPNDTPSHDIVAADFNRITMGLPLIDMVTSNLSDDSISLITNLDNRVFSVTRIERPQQGCDTPSWEFEFITTGRFDAGADEDVVTTETNFDFVDIFLGDMFGNLSNQCQKEVDRLQVHCDDPSAFCWVIDNGHLNGGTKLDLAIAMRTTAEVSILLGKGDGTFQRPIDPCPLPEPIDGSGYIFSVEPPGGPSNEALDPRFVVIVDLDQDGFCDLVTSNFETDNISVLINKLVIIEEPDPNP